MNITANIIIGFICVSVSVTASAAEYKTLMIGNSEVVYDFMPLDKGIASLTMTATLSENNDSFRNTKNNDLRRLSKLGQLIYQCKLMLYQADQVKGINSSAAPILVSKYYSLLTNVDLQLNPNESVGIDVHALDIYDNNSLFTPTLGSQQNISFFRDSLEKGQSTNLKRLNLDVLTQKDIMGSAESVYIDIRFPIFQLNKAVNQWSYSFNVLDFKKAIRYIDDNCSHQKIMDLIKPVDK